MKKYFVLALLVSGSAFGMQKKKNSKDEAVRLNWSKLSENPLEKMMKNHISANSSESVAVKKTEFIPHNLSIAVKPHENKQKLLRMAAKYQNNIEFSEDKINEGTLLFRISDDAFEQVDGTNAWYAQSKVPLKITQFKDKEVEAMDAVAENFDVVLKAAGYARWKKQHRFQAFIWEKGHYVVLPALGAAALYAAEKLGLTEK